MPISRSEQMFHEACTRIADAARRAALALDARFPDFQAAADFVIAEAQSSPDRMGPSWWGYKAAIAAALTGRPEQAAWFFDRLTDPRVTVRARNLRPLLAQPEAFRQAIQAFVGQERQRLMLPPLDTSPFKDARAGQGTAFRLRNGSLWRHRLPAHDPSP
ncbi:hypothetical protein P0F65_02210 [Sphingomonas sp. I4]